MTKNEVNQISSAVSDLKQNLEDAKPAIVKFVEGVQKFLLRLPEIIEKFAEGLEEVAKTFPQLEAEIPKLADRGWFISGYFGGSEIWEFAKLCGNIPTDDLAKELERAYRGSFDEHVASIIRSFPERKFVIEPAADSHRRGDYALSVMAFFSQIDGIIGDRIGQNMFFKGDVLREHAKGKITALKGDERYSRWDVLTPFARIMWQPLSEELPVGFSKSKRVKYGYSGLNRNTVLHGEATEEYATEVNSLKSFSLLSYVAAQMESIALEDARTASQKGSLGNVPS